MSSFRIIQVSDTHLSRRRPYFTDNWLSAARYIADRKPDLVIHTGDVSLDGAGFEDDLKYSLECMESLDVPWLILPGNHDMGEAPGGSDQGEAQPTNDERRALWLKYFGPDYWQHDLAGHRIIGLNTQLFDTGMAEEEKQWVFLREALESNKIGRTLLFLHKPFYFPNYEDEASPRRYLPGNAARHLFEIMDDHPIQLMASGHIHQALSITREDLSIVWSPTTSFVLSDKIQPKIGEKFCGLVEYEFDASTIKVEFQQPSDMETHDMFKFSGMYAELSAATKAMKAEKAGS
jgi:3',5'-cyclic AMP phosphodiesterase CpdA